MERWPGTRSDASHDSSRITKQIDPNCSEKRGEETCGTDKQNANVNLLKFAELFVKMVSAALDGYRYRYRMMNYKYSSPIDADTLS